MMGHSDKRPRCRRAIAALFVARTSVFLSLVSCGQTYLDAIVGPDTSDVEDASEGGDSGRPCPEEQMLCDGVCSDTQTNHAHCGGCENVCSADTTCVAGTCVCPEGYASCNGICVDMMASDEHCGTCGNKCGIPSSCVDGACLCPGMLPYCDGICVNTNNHPNHCGACGHKCPVDTPCINGVCL